jgi:MFS family permease
VKVDRSLTGWYRQSTPKVRRVFWTCAVAWGLDSMDGFVYQYLIPAIVAGLGLTLAQAGSIASANYFSAAIGGWTGGWLADRYGRARVLQVTILWFSIFSFLSGFAQDYTQLLALRTLQGFGFGAEWAVGAVLLGELVAPAHRGKALGAVQSAAGPGSALAALLAGPVAAMLPVALGWRVAFWIGVLPALLVFFVRREGDDAEIYKRAKARAMERGRTFMPVAIFQPKLRRLTALACLLALGAQGAGFAVSNYLTTFLSQERGLSLSAAGIYVLFNSLGGFFGFLTNAYVSDRIGRRLAFRYFAMGYIVAVNLYIFLPLGNSATTLLPAGFVYGFFQFGIYASFGPYFTELFPTEVRATGQSFAYNFGRAASALFIQGVAIVAAYTRISTGMVIMSVTAQLCAILATFFLPETAGNELTDLDSTGVRQSGDEGLAERLRG